MSACHTTLFLQSNNPFLKETRVPVLKETRISLFVLLLVVYNKSDKKQAMVISHNIFNEKDFLQKNVLSCISE